MRYLFILLTILSISLGAENIRWHSSYEKAHQEALKEKKMLMVLLIKDECSDCIKLLQSTLKDKAYIEEINELFVSVLITKDQKESYPIEMLYTMTYPSMFFLNEEELFVGDNIFGYIEADEFENYLLKFKK